MVRTSLSRIFSLLAALVFAAAIALAPALAYADSSTKIVTLGADLTESERATVLSFFNLTEDDLDNMQVIEVTNADERAYLEGVLSDDIIGYATMSCSYIQITSSGGINVETANLTYVTKSIIYNALQTAGVENCNVVVTAPYAVSGTGALTGIFLAFEAEGTTLDEAKKEAATEEMVATAELEETYGSEVAEVISEVKNEAVSSGSDLTETEITELVEETASDYGLSLSADDVTVIVNLVLTIQGLDYDSDAFASTLSSLSENATGIWASIKAFFGGIVDFFADLFSGLFGGEDSSESDSILDDLDTDVFELDDAESDTSESADASSASSEDDTTAAEDVSTSSDEEPTAVTETESVEAANTSTSADGAEESSADTSETAE